MATSQAVTATMLPDKCTATACRRVVALRGNTVTNGGDNDRLMGIVDELTKQSTWFDYDSVCNLTGLLHNNVEHLFRVPDAVGNLYRTVDRSDRKYSAGAGLKRRAVGNTITTKKAT